MTKPITGAAMMMLWRKASGRWTIRWPSAIPQFEGLKVRRKDGDPVAQASPMTMAQLMSHSAGFGRAAGYADNNLRGGDLQDMIDVLAKLPAVVPAEQGLALRAQRRYPGLLWSSSYPARRPGQNSSSSACSARLG